MRFESNSSESKRLPTLSAFLKDRKGQSVAKLYPIQRIWEPGEWQNYTFITDSFMVRIYDSSPMFTQLPLALAESFDNDTALAIEISDPIKAKWALVDMPDESASWSTVGDNGFTLTINDRKRASKKPVSPPPPSVPAEPQIPVVLPEGPPANPTSPAKQPKNPPK